MKPIWLIRRGSHTRGSLLRGLAPVTVGSRSRVGTHPLLSYHVVVVVVYVLIYMNGLISCHNKQTNVGHLTLDHPPQHSLLRAYHGRCDPMTNTNVRTHLRAPRMERAQKRRGILTRTEWGGVSMPCFASHDDDDDGYHYYYYYDDSRTHASDSAGAPL